MEYRNIVSYKFSVALIHTGELSWARIILESLRRELNRRKDVLKSKEGIDFLTTYLEISRLPHYPSNERRNNEIFEIQLLDSLE